MAKSRNPVKLVKNTSQTSLPLRKCYLQAFPLPEQVLHANLFSLLEWVLSADLYLPVSVIQILLDTRVLMLCTFLATASASLPPAPLLIRLRVIVVHVFCFSTIICLSWECTDYGRVAKSLCRRPMQQRAVVHMDGGSVIKSCATHLRSSV